MTPMWSGCAACWTAWLRRALAGGAAGGSSSWTRHSPTMARMHWLQGVTTQERGVSRLLGVDLGLVLGMAEAPWAAE